MIEAVNSVLSSAPLLRQNAEQRSGGALANSSPAPERSQAVVQAPYISPFVSVDVNFDTAVILLRDSETGDTVQQIPSEGRLAAQRRDQVAREAAEARAQELGDPSVEISSSESSVTIDASSTQETSSAPVSTATDSTNPISQAALSAFAAGAQTASTGSSSFVTVA